MARSDERAEVLHFMGDGQATACGQWSAHRFESTTEVGKVTCKRCLRSGYLLTEVEVEHAKASVASRRRGGMNRGPK